MLTRIDLMDVIALVVKLFALLVVAGPYISLQTTFQITRSLKRKGTTGLKPGENEMTFEAKPINVSSTHA